MDEKELWIGLVNVLSMPNNEKLPETKGAYVTVLMQALGGKDFCDLIKAELLSYNYYVIEIEDIEKFNIRKAKYILSDELLSLASETKRTGKIGLCNFHTYDKGEALM
jgi:hypothetical protein